MTGLRSYVSGLSLVLLALVLLLSVLLYHQWHRDPAGSYDGKSNSASPEASEYELTSIRPFQPASFSSLGEIVQRPLFTEGRIPPEKPDAGKITASRLPTLKLKLEGVVISPGSKVAIITNLETRELLRISEGMSHASWKVVAVNEESVLIRQGGKEITLVLEIDDSTGSAGKRSKAPFKLPAKPPVRRR